MKKTNTLYCIGIDGCKDGWIAVYCPALAFERAKVVHYQTLYQLQDDFSENSIIVIDIPIGLERHKANRSCDIEARKLLRQRSSTVFSPPCRDAIYSNTYEEAKKINIQKTGKSISKQSWFISKTYIWLDF